MTDTFGAGDAGRVVIRIHDISGRLVKTLVDGIAEACIYSVPWNGTTNEGGPRPRAAWTSTRS